VTFPSRENPDAIMAFTPAQRHAHSTTDTEGYMFFDLRTNDLLWLLLTVRAPLAHLQSRGYDSSTITSLLCQAALTIKVMHEIHQMQFSTICPAAWLPDDTSCF